jgi:hypothetical protein
VVAEQQGAAMVPVEWSPDRRGSQHSDLKKINADRRVAKAAVRNFVAQHRVHILALLSTTSGNLCVFPDRIVRDRTSEPRYPEGTQQTCTREGGDSDRPIYRCGERT